MKIRSIIIYFIVFNNCFIIYDDKLLMKQNIISILHAFHSVDIVKSMTVKEL